MEHLSIYERRLGLLHLPNKFKKPTQAAVIQVMQKREEALKKTWAMGVDSGGAALGDRVLCAMPFYGVAVGTGHSVAETRFFYLNSTFWSVSKLFQNVVVFVTAMSDKKFLLEQSNLPLFDVVLINGLPKPKYLGVAVSSSKEACKILYHGHICVDCAAFGTARRAPLVFIA